jgi:hypothetical protein
MLTTVFLLIGDSVCSVQAFRADGDNLLSSLDEHQAQMQHDQANVKIRQQHAMRPHLKNSLMERRESKPEHDGDGLGCGESGEERGHVGWADRRGKSRGGMSVRGGRGRAAHQVRQTCEDRQGRVGSEIVRGRGLCGGSLCCQKWGQQRRAPSCRSGLHEVCGSARDCKRAE